MPAERTARRQDAWLLALDGSKGADAAARYVARTAKALGVSDIRLINVRLPSVGSERIGAAARRAQAMQDAQRATATAQRVLGFAGLRFDLDAPVGGDPAAMIVEAAEARAVSEIVMGTRGVGMLSNVALGSVAYKVVHLARRSVTLVPDRVRSEGRGAARNPLSMLVAVDGSSASNRAVHFAALQGLDNSQVRVVLLNVQPKIVSANVRRFVSKTQVDAYVEHEAASATRQAVRILRSAGIEFSSRIATGPAVDAILAVAAESACGRIVLGSRGRGAARSLLLGSVAYGVVHRADIPVTVVKQALAPPLLLSGSTARG